MSSRTSSSSARVAVVTGASSGSGKAIACRFFADGAAVVLVDVDDAGGRSLARELDPAGTRALFVNCDVSQPKSAEMLGAFCSERFAAVDFLVNSAGIGLWGTVETMSLENWNRIMAINVGGVFLVSKYLVGQMRGSSVASIVNIGSGAGLIGTPNSVGYCASKGAVINMTRAMALDLAPFHVRVNCVCPGVVDTPFNDKVLQTMEDPEQTKIAQANAHPLGRLATPNDVAGAVAFLCSEDAGFVTGSVVMVDGGLTAQ